MNTTNTIFLQQELDETNRLLTYCKTAMRNAITEMQEGDIDGAIESLQQIVGVPETAAIAKAEGK